MDGTVVYYTTIKKKYVYIPIQFAASRARSVGNLLIDSNVFSVLILSSSSGVMKTDVLSPDK